MEFKNTTNITHENYLDYLKTKLSVIGKENLKWFVIQSCSLIILSFVISGYKTALIIASVLAFIYICLVLNIKNKISPRWTLRKNYPGNIIFNYDFDEKFFKITDNTKNSKLVPLEYTMLRRICETEKFFYLFYNKSDAYIVDKTGFETPDDIEKLRQILKGSGFLGKYYDLT